MDPADFDVDQRSIPHFVSSIEDVAITPMKKKVRKDPEDLTPENEWKPSAQSSRSSKMHGEVTNMSKFVNRCISSCVVDSFQSLASRWLFRALQVGLGQTRPDYRVIIQMALESAPIDDMDLALMDVFRLKPNSDSSPRSRSKDQYLQGCISRVFDCADSFQG
jgi:hypothetical protein